MSDLYNAADIIDKTLIATKKIPVYKNAVDGAEVAGYVNAGQPVGVVYAWLAANPGMNRSGLWWAFWPVNGMYYYAPHIEGNFSVSALKQQGVISTEEKIKQAQEAENEANKTWYDKIISKYWWIPIAGIAIMQVPGIIKASRS